ncbi:MAG TPA: chemotaxis protein CheA [Gammaproteobacteria bacterium]|nr:chemotaxis protein CheA [Gammaproteobacteria bacterium]
MAIDMDQFLHTFYEESFEGLEIMESNLLNLDVGAADDDMVNSIFRAAHSIKGGSATFGLTDVAEFTHVLETLLDEVRDGKRCVTQELVDLFLRCVDCLKDMLTSLQDGEAVDQEKKQGLQAELEAELNGGDKEPPSEPSRPTEPAAAEGEPKARIWKISFKPLHHLFKTGNDPELIFQELASHGTLQATVNCDDLPILADVDPEDCYLSWELQMASASSRDELKAAFEWVEDDCELSIEESGEARVPAAQTGGESNSEAVKGEHRSASPPPLQKNAPARSGKAGSDKPSKVSKGEGSSIRVSIDKIDDLINMVGELVITQSMLGQISADFSEITPNDFEKLKDGLANLERNTRELQESVMRIRMLPISFAFNRFPRMVHDLSSKLNKSVVLKMSGEQTELDKTVMEKIGDPLVHLVRNSLDHGIETPEERRKAGKPETGTVHLNAFHKGGNIVIEITDDGAGINKERVLRKAIERGLVNEGETLSDEHIYDLLFEPGFSTAAQVSDVSGRGVGMDVVKRNMQDLGGSIELDSVEGQGSTFRIRLPLTLAILDGQLVRVGSDTFIIPLVSIVESLQINEKSVNTIAGSSEIYKLRDDYIPIVRLYDVFGQTPDSENLVGGLLVVVEGEGQKVGLFVDEMLGQQQVVIKSLETNFKRIEGISGATILGDGKVSLILDVAGLIRASQSFPRRPRAPLVDSGLNAVA